MLSQTAVSAMSVLAYELAKKGKVVSVVHETVMAAGMGALQPGLVATTAPVADNTLVNGEPEYTVVEASRYKDASGAYLHDEKMKELRQLVGDQVLANMALARNTVQPLVRRVYDAIDARTEERSRLAMMPISILTHRPAAIWRADALLQELSNLELVAIEKISTTPRWPLPTPDVITARMLTGDPAFDALVAAFIEQEGIDNIVQVFRELFSTAGATSATQRLNDTSERSANFNLTAYLLARGLQRNPLEGLRMSEVDYDTLLRKIYQQAGRSLSRVIKRRLDDERTSNLRLDYEINVTSLPAQTPSTIHVYGPSYVKWLEAGGTPEVLMGSAVSNRNIDGADLIKHKDYYIEKWTVFNDRNQRLVEEQLYNYRCAAICDEVRKIIGEGEYNNDVDPTVLYARLNEVFANTPRTVRTMPVAMARRLVCRVLFPKSDAELILSEQEAAMSRHPGMTAREAALVAGEVIITDFLGKQLQLQSITIANANR